MFFFSKKQKDAAQINTAEAARVQADNDQPCAIDAQDFVMVSGATLRQSAVISQM